MEDLEIKARIVQGIQSAVDSDRVITMDAVWCIVRAFFPNNTEEVCREISAQIEDD